MSAIPRRRSRRRGVAIARNVIAQALSFDGAVGHRCSGICDEHSEDRVVSDEKFDEARAAIEAVVEILQLGYLYIGQGGVKGGQQPNLFGELVSFPL